MGCNTAITKLTQKEYKSVFSLTGTSLVLFFYICKRPKKSLHVPLGGLWDIFNLDRIHQVQKALLCYSSSCDWCCHILVSVFLPNSTSNKHNTCLNKNGSGSHIRFAITFSRKMPALQLPWIVMGILHFEVQSQQYFAIPRRNLNSSNTTNHQILSVRHMHLNSVFPELRTEVEAMQTAKTKSYYEEKEQNNMLLLRRDSQKIWIKNPRN